ncbi:hypothetical protein K2173_014936 [Erythroxylum novogranatense]|uniref:Non-specific lipid-transfer protein n=1 Tax=Erythroxylum novogranatense TaxID=1862640 RepID=A0AAV8TV09_9ROSI|nr:hypothetical protein K2173_014936 [Erythroxylum novogranatense]
MAFMKLLGMFVVCMVLADIIVTDVQAEIDCNSVQTKLLPCLNYLKNGGTPPGPCCDGVKSVNNAATTTADRQQTCQCLKDAAGKFPGINPDNAASLPKSCGVPIPFNISASTDSFFYHVR